jgi:hypothetical protein
MSELLISHVLLTCVTEYFSTLFFRCHEDPVKCFSWFYQLDTPPQGLNGSPIRVERCLINVNLSVPLVRICAAWWYVGQHMIFILSSLTIVRTKWYMISTCFSLGEETSRVAVLIHAWLSSMIIMGELSPIPNSDNICKRYDASCDVAQSATYSASALDND